MENQATNRPGISDQAAILGAVIGTFFALDGEKGAWDITDAIIGAAAGLVLLGFAHVPARPWNLRAAGQAAAIAAIGSLCLFLVSSPIAQIFFTCEPTCPADTCDPGDGVSTWVLPFAVAISFVALLAVFILERPRSGIERLGDRVARVVWKVTGGSGTPPS